MSSRTASEEKRAQDVALAEVVHAFNKLVTTITRPALDYDSVADAAETLTRAANRIAPDGHHLRIERV